MNRAILYGIAGMVVVVRDHREIVSFFNLSDGMKHSFPDPTAEYQGSVHQQPHAYQGSEFIHATNGSYWCDRITDTVQPSDPTGTESYHRHGATVGSYWCDRQNSLRKGYVLLHTAPEEH